MGSRKKKKTPKTLRTSKEPKIVVCLINGKPIYHSEISR